MELNENLDWVTARAHCVTLHVFQELREEIEKDIATRNALLTQAQKNDFIRFYVKVLSASEFTVRRNGEDVVSAMKFECTKSAIRVLNNTGQLLIEAKLTLNEMGECRLVVAEAELSHWQFRRRALQNFFFDF